jgi:hypothetical protein
MLILSRRSELVACLAEAGAFSKREDPGGRDREHWDRRIFAVKGTVANLILPSPVPLGGPHLDEAFEQALVSNLDGVTLNDDVDPCVPVDAASF